LVIYLQNEIEAMMQNYQWELNTQALRNTIKAKADAILEKVKNNGGVYAYLNVCDESNNTPEVIDNEMIIIDTSIEPARGAGKMVQRLTIHKTGGISALTM
jgi:phage tail sheath protein FI